jgi:hypothetical protein
MPGIAIPLHWEGNVTGNSSAKMEIGIAGWKPMTPE